MITLKFGGTSMGSARRILDSVDIMIAQAKNERISVVVSAVAGVSNKLQESIDGCITGKTSDAYVSELRHFHEDICSEIQSQLAGFNAGAVMVRLNEKFSELEKLLNAVSSFGECTDTAHCRIMGMGELLCVPIVEEVLLAKQQSVVVLNSRKYIITMGNQKEGDPDYIKTAENLKQYRDGESNSKSRILLFPGFICSWIGGTGMDAVPGLLGRNGSDFSAAIIGASLGSSKVQFWTDVDGIYTADPRVVKDARPVPEVTYEEAAELAYFGAQVLHPRSMMPCLKSGVPVRVKNSYNIDSPGSIIVENHSGQVPKVTAITSVKNVTLIDINSTRMLGSAGFLAHVFNNFLKWGISVDVIATSEVSVSLTVNGKIDLTGLLQDLDHVADVEIQRNKSIVTIICDADHSSSILASGFGALAKAGINVQMISQGASKVNITVICDDEETNLVVNTLHSAFFA